MNQFFNLKRFGLLVRKHWADNKKRYGLTVLALVGLFTIWFTFNLMVENHNRLSADMQQITYFFSLFIVGTLYASQYYRDLSWRARGINFLLLPASAFEKFLCSLLYNVVIFFTVFTTTFYLVDFVMIALHNNFPVVKAPEEKAVLNNVLQATFFEYPNKTVIYIVMLFFVVQSVFLFGSVLFRKYSFVKTFISGFVILITFMCLIFLFIRNYLLQHSLSEYDLPEWSRIMIPVLLYAIAPIFWIMTYRKLKAKQV